MKLKKRKMKDKIASFDCITNPDARVKISKADQRPIHAAFSLSRSLTDRTTSRAAGLNKEE